MGSGTGWLVGLIGCVPRPSMVVSAFGHFWINHSDRFVKAQIHLNGIENHWNQAKRHLRKYKGIPKQHFNLLLRNVNGTSIVTFHRLSGNTSKNGSDRPDVSPSSMPVP